MIRFEIWEKDKKQRELLLDKEIIRIGRDSDNDVCLDDISVSRHHAEIKQSEDKYFIRDLGSKNGVYVNKQRLLEGMVTDKDEIHLGETKLVFHLIDSDKPSGLEDYLLRLEDEFIHQKVMEREITRNQIRKDLADTEEKPTDIKYLRIKARLQAHIEIVELLLRSELTLTDLLVRIINLIHRHISFDYGAILLYDKKQQKLLPRAVYINPEENTQSLSISASICNTCFSERTAIISSDAFRDPRFEDSESISKYQVRSVMAVPMLGREAPYGVIYVYNKEPQQPYGDDDLNFLIALADAVSLALENFFLREELLRHERL
ncbi:MAG: FHA domain-containing protein, partial [Candidatus Sumerlaeia bacterium]|nr:FHA domain-containing protein [Candidatus Sumerlaeia bacterium]